MSSKLILIIVLGCAFGLTACQQKTTEKAATISEFTGKFYAAGNEPFPRLAFETSAGEKYFVVRQDTAQYNQQWRMQFKQVKIQVKIINKENVNEIIIISFKEINESGN